MNTNNRRIAIALILSASVEVGQAYELATHAKMTEAAFAQSALGNIDKRVQRQIGIDVWSVIVDGKRVPFRVIGFDQYFDNTGSEIRYRTAKAYEGNIIAANIKQLPGAPTEEFSELGWLLRGAIREDYASAFVNFIGRNPKEPQDDPYNNFNRFCNHFFDPLAVPLNGPDKFGRSLTGFCFLSTPIYDNPQWALGSLTPFDVVPTELVSA